MSKEKDKMMRMEGRQKDTSWQLLLNYLEDELKYNKYTKLRSTKQEKAVKQIMKTIEKERGVSVEALKTVALLLDKPISELLKILFVRQQPFPVEYFRYLIGEEKVDTLFFHVMSNQIVGTPDGSFYTVDGNGRLDRKLDEFTLQNARILLLKNGYPTAARRISTGSSFYGVYHLSEIVCTEEVLKAYLFGKRYCMVPKLDEVSVSFINNLDWLHDQGVVLGWLIEWYQKIELDPNNGSIILPLSEGLSAYRGTLEKQPFEDLVVMDCSKATLLEMEKQLLSKKRYYSGDYGIEDMPLPFY